MLNSSIPSSATFSSPLRPVILLVLDGWGVAPPSSGNAVLLAKTPNLDQLLKTFPHGKLSASGESVGLPANEVGNSEVGHLTIGAGRVVLQSLKKINTAIETGIFFDNPAFMAAANHVYSHRSTLHIMGLVSSGNVHASLKHLTALIEFCRRQSILSIRFHLFTDGRDAPPEEGIETIKKIETLLVKLQLGRIATLSGRYYAMDRDQRWDRTEKAYNAIVLGQGKTAPSAAQAISDSYSAKVTDEFIEPTVILENSQPVGLVKDHDAVIFLNFRIDRPRQLTMAFTLPDFEHLKGFRAGYELDQGRSETKQLSGPTFHRRHWPTDLFFVTMTEYQENIPVSAIAFPPEKTILSLTKVVSQAKLPQLHLAESEKERMVTYYFDGIRNDPLPGEDVIIAPSAKIATYDKQPQMSLNDLVKTLISQLKRHYYPFIVINFANADMVAHSGNVKATVKAVEFVDHAIGEVAKAVSEVNGYLVMTADHGNAEELLTYPATSFFFTSKGGDVNTDHSNNPVPFILTGQEFTGQTNLNPNGTLSDIAPTLLSIMHLPIPPEMTGRNLLQKNEAISALKSGIPSV